MKTNKTALMFGAMAVVVSANAQAGVIWSDNFEADTTTVPLRDFTGTGGPDWAPVTSGTTVVTLGTRVLQVNDASTSASRSGTVAMTQFAPFDTSLAADRVFQASFDLRYDSYTGAGGTLNARVVLRNAANATDATLVIGFGSANVVGDSTREMLLFAGLSGNGTLAPSASNAIGLTGATWAPGFDFGTYSDPAALPVAGDALLNDTNDEFYRFNIRWDTQLMTNAINGTVTRLSNTAQTTSFILSTANPVGFASTDTNDNFQFTSASTSTGVQYIDNISFVTVPIPEPTAGLIGAVACVGGLLRRRRA